ncbi:hypothetical protein E4U21_000546 [Claviceps maximensis]|nr:hypothetical protein E4U21_000546 [Claviceps maximensis]
MHSLWCCGPRQGRLKQSSFTSIFKTSRKRPVVNTSGSHISQAKLTSEQVSPFGGPIELCQILDSHAETEDVRGSEFMSRTNTFEGIKARMIKHLSQDVSSRRHSRVSIGHSDEELARRAEVRRLRQKRIQDELERDDEGHAPSVRSNHDTQRLATFVEMGSPRNGPRDTIEFSVDDCAVALSPDSDPSSSHCSQTCAATCFPDTKDKDICYDARCSLQPQTQSDAEIIPSHISSNCTPIVEQKRNSTVTTLLRPSSEPGTSGLEKVLGGESDFNIRHGSHAWDDQSALGVWLIAQGIKLNDISVSQNETSIRPDCSAVRHASSTSVDIGGVDSIIESSFSMPDDTLNAKPWYPDDGEHEDLAAACADTEKNNERSAKYSTSDLQAAGRVEDKESSNYPSAIPSVEPSPSVSESHSYILSQRDMENLELSPIRWYRRLPTCKELGHSERQSSYTTAEEQVFSNVADGIDVPELLGAFICHSDRPKRESRNLRPAGEQILAPDLNKPLPVPAVREIPEEDFHLPASLSRDSCVDILQGTPKRASLKQKIQKSLSGLSKLGDYNKTDRTMPKVPSSRESQNPIMSHYK